MGLAAAKNKRKLGNDPNNTKWSRNTDSFGQKILRAQGWQPGQYLGAKDAPHAEWHTEANSAHIRVVLKDDNLGLGAKRNNGDECTGLDAFQHLLGRLNGKSDETLETERKVREDMRLSLYVERKLGTIRFVKGGWLVGDQVKDKPSDEDAEPQGSFVPDAPKDSAEDSGEPELAPKKPKKQKAGRDTDMDGEEMRKKEKKSKKRKADSEVEADNEGARKKDKKSKKRRSESEEVDTEPPAALKSSKRKKGKEMVAEDSSRNTSIAVSQMAEFPDEDANSARETRRGRKEKKRKRRIERTKKRKKEKRKAKASSDSGPESGDSISREKKRRKDDNALANVTELSDPTAAESSLSTPGGSGYSTPVPTGPSRYLARSRFIAQKKMAFTDSSALNQVRLLAFQHSITI
ncbi:Protein PXR1 [Madurella mycetomatis]|uniref:PinX1-related protein 1 n=1 Tax=Madurella mycetomatis TaxID=100816 RepID=A0A175W5E8_9PEZI|nr:Protein PXR1 [Madurella mycetomatis]